MKARKHRLSSDWLAFFKGLPDIVTAIVTVMVVFHVIVELLPSILSYRVWGLVMLSPTKIAIMMDQGRYFQGLALPFPGHIFFHVNLAHLLMNGLTILIMGSYVYREMATRPTVGKNDAPVAFILFFMLSGMFAGLAFVFATANSGQSLLGASGAGAGLFGACVWILVTRQWGAKASSAFVARSVIVLGLISVVVMAASYYLDTSKLSYIVFHSASAWQAHMGGYVFGLLTYPFFERMAALGR